MSFHKKSKGVTEKSKGVTEKSKGVTVKSKGVTVNISYLYTHMYLKIIKLYFS